MSTRLKRQGATIGFFGKTVAKNTSFGWRARQYNFIADKKDLATLYANWTASPRICPGTSGADAVPKLVRMFRTPDFPRIERDPDGDTPEHRAYRTRGDIPAHSVRQGKGVNRYSGEILAALQKRIEAKFKVSLSHDEIERALLGGAESNSSEDDFS